MDFIIPDNDEVHDEAQPHLLSWFKEVVIYTHDTIFRVMSRRVEVDSFKNPEPPRVKVGKFSLSYAFIYKADDGKFTELLIEYDKKNTRDRCVYGYNTFDGVFT